MLSKEKHAWIAQTLKIDVNFAEVETEQHGPGFSKKAMKAQYKGEEDSLAWHAPRGKNQSLQSHIDRRNSKHTVVRRLDEQEMRDKTLTTNDQGQVVDKNGAPVTAQKLTYVTDGETGDMRGTNETWNLRDLDTNTLSNVPDHRAASQTARASNGTKRLEGVHHSTLSNGKDVAGAGEITIEAGKVTEVDNSSGHFRPQFTQLLQTVEQLLKSGALVDKQITDVEGNAAPPKAVALYQKLQKKMPQLQKDRATLNALLRLDPEDFGEARRKELERAKKAMAARMDPMIKAFDALATMGIGPSNRISGLVKDAAEGDPRVTHISGNEGGSIFHVNNVVDRETMSVGDFIRGKDDADGVKKGSKESRRRTANARKALNEEFNREHREKRRPENLPENTRKQQIFETTAPTVSAKAWDAELNAAHAALGDDLVPDKAPAVPAQAVNAGGANIYGEPVNAGGANVYGEPVNAPQNVPQAQRENNYPELDEDEQIQIFSQPAQSDPSVENNDAARPRAEAAERAPDKPPAHDDGQAIKPYRAMPPK